MELSLKTAVKAAAEAPKTAEKAAKQLRFVEEYLIDGNATGRYPLWVFPEDSKATGLSVVDLC